MTDEATPDTSKLKTFVVSAIDEAGDKHELEVEAASLIKATTSVKEQGMSVIDAYEADSGDDGLDEPRERPPLTPRDRWAYAGIGILIGVVLGLILDVPVAVINFRYIASSLQYDVGYGWLIGLLLMPCLCAVIFAVWGYRKGEAMTDKLADAWSFFFGG